MLVQYNESITSYYIMTTLTIRIEDDLKTKAFKQADKLGIPLTLIVKNALKNFIETQRVTIGEPEMVQVTPVMQKTMDEIRTFLLSKK